MKEYFTRLFNYDKYTNLLVAENIVKAGSPNDSTRLMAHLLTAQQIWLARCNGESATGRVLWPEDWKADELAKVAEENGKAWLDLLNTYTAADFDKTINYQNLQGDSFENKLSDILAHVINHGTHHRAQIGQQLKLSGIEKLPVTDYIYYIRTH
ncbi:DinB family protein [Mucilaginibacter ginsenosidivorans]|uniref:Damage-inducible protein DinB n=1 Tax=Mucilaginibacter ginsenosidivorans TaxID=398053 RepID=A0A5B8UYW8_9SPHI|nr:DinB family protein [Mucilaginibacter ginsenosidivorans]QEC64202.1 hypothetical protein FRZ54_16990 [Mucilaginibacter ginsenosidivorans]